MNSLPVCIRPLNDNESAILTIEGMCNGVLETFQCPLTDNEELRLLTANLNVLKQQDFKGALTVKFSDSHIIKMHSSIWTELANALFAFTLRIDLLKLGV